jgi:hypothetical protein
MTMAQQYANGVQNLNAQNPAKAKVGVADPAPRSDGSNLTWITQARMADLVQEKLAHAVKLVNPHRVIITPYGEQIRAFDYQLVVNPGKGGPEEWRLAKSYGLGPIGKEADIPGMMENVDTDAVAQKLAKWTNESGVHDSKMAGLQTLITGLTMLPGVGAVDAAVNGQYVDATISAIGDLALLGGLAVKVGGKAVGAAKTVVAAAKAVEGVVRFRAVQGTIAVVRLGQAGYAVMQGDNGKAAAYLGEAILRILGVAYTRVAPIRFPSLPAVGHSRALTAADLGLGSGVQRLAGTVSVRGTTVTVRVENIAIAQAARGQTSMFSVMENLRGMARQGGMQNLVIEGVSVGNPDLAAILIQRYGATVTPQRTLVANIPLN